MMAGSSLYHLHHIRQRRLLQKVVNRGTQGKPFFVKGAGFLFRTLSETQDTIFLLLRTFDSMDNRG